MKHFISRLTLLSIALLGISLSSCKDQDEKDQDNLVGLWVETVYGDTKPYSYQFNEDGSGFGQTYPNGSKDYFDDYKVKDQHLLLKWTEDDEFENMGTIEINGDAFELDLYDEDSWVTYTRQ